MPAISIAAALTSLPDPQEPAVPGLCGTRRGRLRQRLALAAHTHHSAREPRAHRRPFLPQRLLLHLHARVQRAAGGPGRPGGARRRRRRAPGEHPSRVHAHQLPPLYPDVAGAAWTLRPGPEPVFCILSPALRLGAAQVKAALAESSRPGNLALGVFHRLLPPSSSSV